MYHVLYKKHGEFNWQEAGAFPTIELATQVMLAYIQAGYDSQIYRI